MNEQCRQTAGRAVGILANQIHGPLAEHLPTEPVPEEVQKGGEFGSHSQPISVSGERLDQRK